MLVWGCPNLSKPPTVKLKACPTEEAELQRSFEIVAEWLEAQRARSERPRSEGKRGEMKKRQG